MPSFKVLYGRSCDGGTQERDKACELILEVFKDAEIETEVQSAHNVIIFGPGNAELIKVADQRDLYRKYQWPAAAAVTTALQEFKSTLK